MRLRSTRGRHYRQKFSSNNFHQVSPPSKIIDLVPKISTRCHYCRTGDRKPGEFNIITFSSKFSDTPTPESATPTFWTLSKVVPSHFKTISSGRMDRTQAIAAVIWSLNHVCASYYLQLHRQKQNSRHYSQEHQTKLTIGAISSSNKHQRSLIY